MKVATVNNIIPNILANTYWSHNGVTVAGGNGPGYNTNQLNYPHGLFFYDDHTIVIADWGNHRIVQWKIGDANGQIVAGGNGEGNRLDQLNNPTDVLIDIETDSLIICDWGNQRVVRWSRHRSATQGEILIDNISCLGLAMDDQRNLYVSDRRKHEVRRYRIGENIGTIVAGGNGEGSYPNQLNIPGYIFVDKQQTVYVSDNSNHRVMKWDKGAKEGILIAGGQGAGDSLTQLYYPSGLFLDTSGDLYVADYMNNRVLRWRQGATQGAVIAGGYGDGSTGSQFSYLTGLSLDSRGNLYVADYLNHRLQRFSVE